MKKIFLRGSDRGVWSQTVIFKRPSKKKFFFELHFFFVNTGKYWDLLYYMVFVKNITLNTNAGKMLKWSIEDNDVLSLLKSD